MIRREVTALPLEHPPCTLVITLQKVFQEIFQSYFRDQNDLALS